MAAGRGDEQFTPDRHHDAGAEPGKMRGSIEPAVPPWPRVGYEEDEQAMLQALNRQLGDPTEARATGSRRPRQAAAWEEIKLSGLAGEISLSYYLCGVHTGLSKDQAWAIHYASVDRNFRKVIALTKCGAASPLFLSEVDKLHNRPPGRPKGKKTISYAMLAASDVDRILAVWRAHYPEVCRMTKGLRDLACKYAALRWGISSNSVKNCISRARWRELP